MSGRRRRSRPCRRPGCAFDLPALGVTESRQLRGGPARSCIGPTQSMRMNRRARTPCAQALFNERGKRIGRVRMRTSSRGW